MDVLLANKSKARVLNIDSTRVTNPISVYSVEE